MLQNHDRPGWPARRSAAMRSSPNRGPNGFLARYSRQLPSHDVELHLLNFGGYFLPLILLRDPLLRGLGISTRVELVLYAVNNRDPRQAEWRAGASRIPPA
jgi:hypothetical protein